MCVDSYSAHVPFIIFTKRNHRVVFFFLFTFLYFFFWRGVGVVDLDFSAMLCWGLSYFVFSWCV